VLAIFTMSMIALSLLDVAALYLLSSVLRGGLAGGRQVSADLDVGKLLVVLALFCTRSALALANNWLTFKQLAIEETRISIHNFEKLVDVQTLLPGTPDIHFQNSVDRGPQALLQMIMYFASWISEACTGIVLFGAFLYLEPLTASISIIYFAIVMTIQLRVLAIKMKRQGTRITDSTNSLYRFLEDAAQLRRILQISSRKSIVSAVAATRSDLSRARSTSGFYSVVPRYLLELTVVVGIVIIGGVSFAALGSASSLASIILFAGVSFRLLPVINQLQALFLASLRDLSTGELALAEFPTEQSARGATLTNSNLVELDKVNFRYSGRRNVVVSDLSLEIIRGEQHAIVGRSGSGKTTIIDLLVGLLQPTDGEIRQCPNLVTAYVSQDMHVAFASLAKNIALEWDTNKIDYGRVASALHDADLAEFTHKCGDPTPLTNASLSGGQKQRLGLARALYMQPELLVLDEVTSSLDSASERSVVETIGGLRGKVATVVVTHRLSTLKYADVIYLVQNGTVRAVSSLSELLSIYPDIALQSEADDGGFKVL